MDDYIDVSRRIYFRTTRGKEKDYEKLWAILNGAEAFRMKGKISNEGLINAILFWVESLPPEQVAQDILPHLEAWESLWSRTRKVDKEAVVEDRPDPGVESVDPMSKHPVTTKKGRKAKG